MGNAKSKSRVTVGTSAHSEQTTSNAIIMRPERTSAGHAEPTITHAITNRPWKRGCCVVKNETDRTLYLVDKVGSAYSNKPRYEIPANSQIEVESLQNTFYRMVVFAVKEDEEDGGQEMKARDTKVTIDTDQMAEHKIITLQNSSDGSGALKMNFN